MTLRLRAASVAVIVTLAVIVTNAQHLPLPVAACVLLGAVAIFVARARQDVRR